MFRYALRRLASRRLAKDRKGLAGIEFAIVAPFLLIMLVGVVDVGLLVYNRMDTTSAVQTGAQYFMGGGSDINQAITAVKRSWTSMPANTEVSSAKVCYCANVVASCTQNCPDDSLPVAYHTISAKVIYSGTLIKTEYVISESVRVR